MLRISKQKETAANTGRQTPDQISSAPLITPPCTQSGFHFGRPKFLRRMSSTLSMSSVSSNGDDDIDDSPSIDDPASSSFWSNDDENLLKLALEEFSNDASATPFDASKPPSQLTHQIARSVVKQKRGDWQHTLKQTRAKILELARSRSPVQAMHDATPRRNSSAQFCFADTEDSEIEMEDPVVALDPDATPRIPQAGFVNHRKRPAPSRQTSSDFLPVAREPGTLARLSNKLMESTSPQAVVSGRGRGRGMGIRSSSCSMGSGAATVPISMGNPLTTIPASPRTTRSNTTSRMRLSHTESEPVLSLGKVEAPPVFAFPSFGGPPSPRTPSESGSIASSGSYFTLNGRASSSTLATSFGSDSYSSPPSSLAGSRRPSLAGSFEETCLQTPRSAKKGRKMSFEFINSEAEVPSYPATPKSMSKSRRPSLTVEGRMSSMSLRPKYSEPSLPVSLPTPSSIPRYRHSSKDLAPPLEIPASPSKSDLPGRALVGLNESSEMELDSPFHEQWPANGAWSLS